MHLLIYKYHIHTFISVTKSLGLAFWFPAAGGNCFDLSIFATVPHGKYKYFIAQVDREAWLGLIPLFILTRWTVSGSKGPLHDHFLIPGSAWKFIEIEIYSCT